MQKLKLCFLLFLSLFIFSLNGYSKQLTQEELMQLDITQLMQVKIISSTGTDKTLGSAPSVVTVITSEEIKNSGARFLDDVLESVPGLHVIPSSKVLLNSTYSIRGIYTNLNPQVLVLINGIPIVYPYTSSRPFNFQLPAENISRVEIVRGPVSANFGADAFAGVINVITKTSEEINGTNTKVRYGSFNTKDFIVQHGAKYLDWNINFSTEYQTSDGDSDRIIDSDLQSMLDSALGTNASLAPGPVDTRYEVLNSNLGFSKGNWNINFYGWSNKNAGGGFGATEILAPDTSVDTEMYIADCIYNNKDIKDGVELNVRYYYRYLLTEPYLNLFPAGAVLPIGSDGNISFAAPRGVTYFPDGVYGFPTGEDTENLLECTLLYSNMENHLLRMSLGGKYSKEIGTEQKNFGPGVLDGTQSSKDGTLVDVTGTEYIFMEDQTRKLVFMTLQDEWAFIENWELTAGVRYDHYSDFGGTTNPRLALVWDTTSKLTTKLLYGEAFREPSFTELYVKNNPSNTGNPNLDPETIKTMELVFDYKLLSNLRVALNIFSYEIKDLIELVQDPGETTLTSQNTHNQEGYGCELEMNWLASDTVNINSNFAFQNSEDSDTNQDISYAPGRQFFIGANWKFIENWYLNLQNNWVGDRKRDAGDTRDEVDDYNQVNFFLRSNISDNLKIGLGIKNVLDEDIREPGSPNIPNDIPMEGRSIYGDVQFSF